MVDVITDQLKQIGQENEQKILLAETALLIAAIDQPGIHLDRYQNHLTKMAETLHNKITQRAVLSDAHDELMARVELLNEVIRGEFKYIGDEDGYDNLDNTSLIQVIERRRGIPVALGILYLHVARAVGWEIDGLNFPGHFLVRLGYQGQREIIDPFYEGQVMDAACLRALVKNMLGKGAELNYDYYTPMNNRSILLRLCNNRKTRLIAGEDFKSAMKTVETMLLIAPNNVRLRFDAGVLSARLDQRQEAINHLEHYIENIGDPMAVSEASALLISLKRSLQ